MEGVVEKADFQGGREPREKQDLTRFFDTIDVEELKEWEELEKELWK